MPTPKYFRGKRREDPPVHPKEEDDGDIPSSQMPASSQLAPPTQLDRPAECINRKSTPPFSVICAVMDRLRNEKAGKRYDILNRLFNMWREKVGNDLYPLIRLLLPDRDRERPVYNLKEAMLAKCYIEVLGLDKQSDSAQRLTKWKQPVEGQNDISGDFARVCYHEIAARSTVEAGQLSVDAVNSLLDEMSKGKMKQAEYIPILRRINEQCSPTEQEWIIRIILKDLRISIREKGIFSCFHPEAATLFNVCSDLKRVCWILYSPEIRLKKEETNIELFRCFLPQLCHRSPTSSHNVIAQSVGAPAEFIMEEKLDGERIQLHMRGSGAEWFYCSRKAKDYTNLYGAHIGEGSLTQFIRDVFQDGVRNIILDGEMMVWDPDVGKYLAFGSLKTAALDKTYDENSPRPCFKVFDVLYLNDKCLTGCRLSERKRLLHSGRIFKNIEKYKGRIEFVDEERGTSGKDIRTMLERVLEQKGEGIVVKRADSPYVTNSRGPDWIKVKPEYADQMGENLDVLVLGGWWGQGGRTGKISSLLVGLRVPQDDEGSDEIPAFKTFAKIGSGMSYGDYNWILNHHKEHWKPFDRYNPPYWMHVGATGTDDKPDVYIEPEQSFVVTVKASEIVTAAGGYGSGYTLRFPRCRFIHWDKESREHPESGELRERNMWNALSFDEFLALMKNPKKRYVDDEGGSARKKRKLAATTSRKVQLMQSFKGQKLSDEDVENHIFGNITFFIPKDVPGYTKQDLEALVHKHGGDFVQGQLSDNSALVISNDDKSPRVKAQIKKGNDIIKPEWILESIKRRRPIPKIKALLVVASDLTKDDRYYKKTLEEIDKINFVRDRTGNWCPDDEAEEDDEQQEDDEEEDDGGASGRQSPESSPAPDAVAADSLATNWGIQMDKRDYSGRPNDEDANDNRDDHDEGDSESEPDAWDDEDEDGKDDEDEDNGNDHDHKPLFPLLDKSSPPTDHQPMGDTLEADAYDEENLFAHLVFYIDTPENALKNDLPLAKTSPPPEAAERLAEASKLLLENGGTIVDDVLHPRLTHIIQDDADLGRYVELYRRTNKPKHKHIVLPSWVVESVDEETLLEEDFHKPA